MTAMEKWLKAADTVYPGWRERKTAQAEYELRAAEIRKSTETRRPGRWPLIDWTKRYKLDAELAQEFAGRF